MNRSNSFFQNSDELMGTSILLLSSANTHTEVTAKTMAIDYQSLEAFSEQVLATGRSIRWAAVVNDNGVILSYRQRQGLSLLLTHEENEEYAVSAISRHKTRTKFESKTKASTRIAPATTGSPKRSTFASHVGAIGRHHTVARIG